MGRKRSYTPLNVFLNSRLVGQLVREPSGGVSFAYARDWLEWEHRMPVSLSLPLQENRYSGAPVMAVFDNLLPDSDLIRRRVAERVGAEGVDAFSLLSQIGRDCVGALQFLPCLLYTHDANHAHHQAANRQAAQRYGPVRQR